MATVRRTVGGHPTRIAQLCEVCLHEGRLRVAGGTRQSGFDQFFAELFGTSGAPGQTGGAPASGDGVTDDAGVANGVASSGLGAGDPPAGGSAASGRPVDITRFFSDATKQLLQRAARYALAAGSPDVDPDHLLLAGLDDDTIGRLLTVAGADPQALRSQLEAPGPGATTPAPGPEGSMLGLAPETKRALLNAFVISRQLGAGYIGPEHVLLALAADGDSTAGRLLGRAGVGQEDLLPAVHHGGASGGGKGGGTPTPTVDEYSRDLTQLARDGKLDPVIGRDDEVDQTLEVLSRRTKNNPVLIGDPGVGKTAIVEGIAQRIVDGDVPESLAEARLVGLDLAGMIAGSRYRGEFEERLRTVLDEITRSQGQLLVFIDELHTIVGAGAAEGAMDAANMLKPALSRGELHVIGATTLDEYRRHVEKDAALERRFQPIMVEEPPVEETIQILFGLKDRYEAYHRVRIADDAIVAAAELSDRYIADRYLPDKAIDLIDQASARVKIRRGSKGRDRRRLTEEMDRLEREKQQAVAAEDFERAAELKRRCEEVRAEVREHDGQRQRAPEVTTEDVAEVVSRATGIPVSQLTEEERERLLDLEERLHQRVVGQDEAVRAVAEAVRRSRAGLAEAGRPIGSFLFLGPTGVGKTELARTLADALFGDEEHVVRLDMSEFQERHTVSRLVGAPPGYVGYEEAGQLTERIRRRPYSVLLLDEIEKAHPDVFNLLLQVLEDGRLTDSQGRTVNFENTVVVMTSNLGADRIVGGRPRQPFGFAADEQSAERDYEVLRDQLWGVLREHFRPEFLNRIDDVVVFRELDRDQLMSITRLLVDGLVQRMRAQRIEVEFTDAALEHLAEVGFDPDFGARPLRRAIQRRVENELSRLVLEGELEAGDRVTVGSSDSHLDFDVDEGGNGDGSFEDWQEPHHLDSPTPAGPSAPRPD